MKKYYLLLIISAYLILNPVFSQESSILQSGPMIGYADMQEVMIWVQTNKNAEVYVEY